MPLTPTETKLVDLFVKYGDYSPRRAQEAALVLMRGQASYGAVMEDREDTQTTYRGKTIDLDEIKTALQARKRGTGGG
jgi:hypothetical protein